MAQKTQDTDLLKGQAVSAFDHPLTGALLNVANINGLAATLLSAFFVGPDALGTLIFGGAVIWGALSKYFALRYKQNPDPNKARNPLMRVLMHPSSTAVVLTIAALTNGVQSGGEFLNATSTSERALSAAQTFAWSAGAGGDTALIVNDWANFDKEQSDKRQSQSIWKAALANPVLFYAAGAIGFAAAALMTASALTTLSLGVGVASIALSLSALTLAAWRTREAAKGRIEGSKIANKTFIGLSAAGQFALGGFAFLTGNPVLGFAQLLFATSNLLSLRETRNALEMRQGPSQF